MQGYETKIFTLKTIYFMLQKAYSHTIDKKINLNFIFTVIFTYTKFILKY